MRSDRKRYFAASGLSALALLILAIVIVYVKDARGCDDCLTTTASKTGDEASAMPDKCAHDNATASGDALSVIPNVIRAMGEFTDYQGIYRQYVLIEADLTDDDIVRVARRLHAIEPDTWWHLMDSDAAFDTMLTALPETAEGNFDNWPREYIREHFVARVMLELRGDGKGAIDKVWLVEGGPKRPRLEAELS